MKYVSTLFYTQMGFVCSYDVKYFYFVFKQRADGTGNLILSYFFV